MEENKVTKFLIFIVLTDLKKIYIFFINNMQTLKSNNSVEIIAGKDTQSKSEKQCMHYKHLKA